MVKTPSAAKLVLAEFPVFELTFGLDTHGKCDRPQTNGLA